MNCTQTDALLDAYMDDALAEGDRAALAAHCADCPACAEKYRATEVMKRMFSEMAPEVDVPLAAQAGWRRAVKAEAQRSKRQRLYKMAGGIAAALVVAVGATFALMANPAQKDVEMRSADLAGAQSIAMIEADGEIDAAAEAVLEDADFMPMHELEMTVEDLDSVCVYMTDLVSEYEGDADVQPFEEEGRRCANLYIDLPTENADEFLSAASHYDASGSTLTLGEAAGERVSMLLVLKEG